MTLLWVLGGFYTISGFVRARSKIHNTTPCKLPIGIMHVNVREFRVALL